MASIIHHIRTTRLGWTQAEMAKAFGVTQPTLSRWERGQGAPTTAQVAAILCAARTRGVSLEPGDFFATPSETETAA